MTFDEAWEKLKSENPDVFTRAEQMADDFEESIQYAYDQGFKSGYELGKEERPHGEEWIENFIKNYNASKDFQITDIRDREKLLDELRPHGKWIFHKDYNERKYGCNQCGNLNNIPSNFCPECGAKMDRILP